jgi:hypothetical protein
LNKKILEARKMVSKPSQLLFICFFGRRVQNQIGPKLLSHLKVAPF